MTAAPPPGFTALKVFAVGAVALYATHLMTAGHDEMTARPVEAHAPVTLLEEHADDCWTDEAPADTIPGHVIWQHPDGTTVYSSDLVGPALDTLFADGNLPGAPIAFCL